VRRELAWVIWRLCQQGRAARPASTVAVFERLFCRQNRYFTAAFVARTGVRM